MLLFAGCISQTTSPDNTAPKHSIAGAWYTYGNTLPLTLYQDGKNIHGNQQMRTRDMFDSIFVYGIIYGDSVKLFQINYSHDAIHGATWSQQDILASLKTDSLMQGIVWEDSDPTKHTNIFHAIRY